jgi:hydroxymethylpyrimidine pyrophosphatase-like HAD family hydrolase
MGYADLPVYAVGDGENDLALKDMVEQFFVPSTAQKSVRDHADVVIDRAQEGVLSPILDLIL